MKRRYLNRAWLAILILCCCCQVRAQLYCPSNINFELGNLSRWQFDTAMNNGLLGITTPGPTPPIAGRHTLTSGATTDYYGGFPIVDPIGGNYSLRLGNDHVGAEVDRVRYTLTVPMNVNNYSLVYRYAVVFENPSHAVYEQPFFRVRVYDSATNAVINCASFTYVSQSSLPGFSTSSRRGQYGRAIVYYKPWATASLNLTGQAGKTLVVEFTAADCALSAHMGYGYVDMGCGLFAISSSTCNPTSPLTAPSGFQKYTWYNSNYSAIVDSGQTITVATPTALTKYNVVLTPYPGYGCQDTLTTQIIGSSLAVNAGPDTMLCDNQSISLNPTVTGNGSPFAYNWSPAPSLSCASCLSPMASPLVNTRYALRVTDSFGCVRSDTIEVRSRVDLSAAAVPVTCFGGSNGSATAVSTFGTPPYSYRWNSTPVQTTSTASMLSAGSYTVIATDARGCTDTQVINITSPPKLLASITAVDSVSCHGGNNGKATTAATGGIGPYAYSWNTSPVQTTATATGLLAGMVLVTATDSKGCTDTEAAIIPQPLPIAATVSLTHILCKGKSTGTVSAIASGGASPYQYAVGTSAFSSGNSFAGLTAGSHIIHLKDARNCLKDTAILLTEPAPLVIGHTALRPLCADSANGSITMGGQGGVPPYQYAIGAGSFSTTTSYGGLSAGTYLLHLKDANGCTKDSLVTLGQPPPLGLSLAIGHVPCHGAGSGSIGITVSGGTPTYAYALGSGSFGVPSVFSGLSAGAHIVRVKDANSCTKDTAVTVNQPPALGLSYVAVMPLCNGASNGSIVVAGSGGLMPYQYAINAGAFGSAGTFSGLNAGTYTLHMRDANNCTKDSIIILSQPPLLSTTATRTNVSCFGGSNGTALASVTGGTSPYTYSWTGTAQTTASVTGLSAGSYTATVTDSKGCSSSATVAVSQPAAISTAFTTSPPICFNTPTGSATVLASGGTSPFTYSWTTTPAQTGATASALSAGSYTVTVTDAAGCTGTGTAVVPQTPQIVVNLSPFAVSCYGGKDGSVIASASGGVAPYTYVWNTSQTGDTLRSVQAGSYSVTATSAAGCKGNATVTLSQPAALLTATTARATCPGLSQGRIASSVSGGTAPYSYLWSTSPAQTTATAVGLSLGSYTLMVTDAKDCKDSAQDIISAFIPPVVDAGPDVEVCLGNGVPLFASGADTYEWSPSATLSCSDCAAPTASPTIDTKYLVVGTDTNGCKGMDSLQVKVIRHVDLSVDPKRIICEGDSVRLGAQGGIALRWLPPELIADKDTSRPMVRPTVTTIFQAVITENECFKDTLEQEVEVLPTPVVDLGPDLEALVGSTIELQARVSGATKIAWQPATGLSCVDCFRPSFVVRGKHTFIAEVQNILGCPATDTINIRDVCDEHYFYFANVFTPNGDGQNDRFYPQGIGTSLVAHFMIYDRWGETVFSASNIYVNDPSAGWDGTFRNQALKPDVYVYVMDALCENGQKVVIRGDISLIR